LADDSEKTEPPTPKRRREAREKGQVLKSKEVNTAVLVLVAAYSLLWFGKRTYIYLFTFFVNTMEELPYNLLSASVFIKFNARAILVLLSIIIPTLMAVFIAALLVEVLQVGILFTLKPLKPDLTKINPIKGFKRVFSLKSLVELVKGLVKTIIIGYIVYGVLRDNLKRIIGVIREPPAYAFSLSGELVIVIAKKVAAAMIIIAGIDYFYQRWEFEKSLKMSKQEVKDEYKQTEGDPLIKSKQRQKQRQISRGQVRQAVADSSAVVSNPTHYAVALKYDPESMDAPIVMAKGEDEMAIFIKELANKFDVPIFEDVELARALFAVTLVDRPIPPEFYMAVAQIIAEIMKKKKEKAFLDAIKKSLGKKSYDDSKESQNDTQKKSGPSSIFD